jgi:RimJ/RimL family protein N-acetyltransferase
MIALHFNDWEVRRFLNMITPVSKEEEEEWIRSTWELRSKGTAYIFGIEVNKSRLLIGSCGLHWVDKINRSAGFGIALYNKAHWNKGYGTEATRLILGYGFHQLNLHRIHLTVFEFNERARHLYEKVGFTHVGRHRNALFRNGRYWDIFIMDFLAREYHQKYTQ